MSELKQPTNDRQGGKRLWSKQEDELLSEIVGQHCELKWAIISEQFNLNLARQGSSSAKRSNKQCRERWQNHLNPLLQNSAEWSQAEHELLFTLFREHSHQWCRISQLLEEGGFRRRGDNHIKNYFYSSIKRAIKRINEVVRESNRAIKKQKSILYQYNQKYAYKKRLSLQRQILAHPTTPTPTPAFNHNSESTGHDNALPQIEMTERESKMRIIKELDQEIVSKILLIAQQRGAKKFTISNKNYEEEAVNTRNKLIDYIKNGEEFTVEDVVQLTTEILELSRKCKRKTCKSSDVEEDRLEAQPAEENQCVAKEQAQDRQEMSEDPIPMKASQGGQASQGGKKSEPLIVQADRKNSQQDKNLLQRYLYEEGDNKLGEMQKKWHNSDNPSPKPDEGANSISGFLHLGQDSSRLFMDQSNSYFNISGALSNRDNQISYYDPNAFTSLAYADFYRSRKEEESHTNLADLHFINSIKMMDSKMGTQQGGLLDLDFTPFPAVNPFAQGLFRQDSDQDRLFASQLQPQQRASSHRSNHSRSRPAEPFQQQGQGLDLFQSQQLLNRSWAYSTSRLENGRQLCNSNNYEAVRKTEFTVDLRNSNFYPFSKPE